MNRFFGVLAGLIMIGFLLMSCFGLWHFVNSSAAEAQAWVLVESFTKVLVMLGTGLLIILICLGIGGFIFLAGHGIRAGAEPMANAAGVYLLARNSSQLMIPGSGVEMPDIRIWPPVEIIGGDLCLPEPEHANR